MRRTAAVLFTIVVVVGACSSGGDETASTNDSTTTTEATTTTTIPTEPALWSDEPCTRAVTAANALPATVGYRLDDLEHMVLSRDDVGGLSGMESDMTRHGYWGNGEFTSMEVNPPSTCDDLKKFGRVTGFANAYLAWTEPQQLVTFSVHLFHSSNDARAWVDAYTNALKSSAGTKDGPSRFDAQPLPELGDGAVLAEHEGSDGRRTWVMFVRGPIVGWVTKLNRNVDVVAAAKTMATRIEGVASRQPGIDAARLVSAPLPLRDYEDRYAALRWNFFFGGCADTEERGYVVGEDAAKRVAAFGRIAGCTNMYDPPEGSATSIVRVYSNVQVFKDAAGVSADIADRVSRLGADHAQRFEVNVGDEALATVSSPHGDQSFTMTSVVFRIGNLEAAVAIQDKDQRDARAEITALATKLAARVNRLTASAS